jgi:nucleotide-binding universal stress UspA family protein
MFQRILVPTDGSDNADRAVEYAIELAERSDAIVHALFVVDTTVHGEPALSSTEVLVSELEDYGTDVLTAIQEQADYSAVTVKTERTHGTPYEEIVDHADDIDADIIVMGYQGTTHRGKIGSTASRVMRMADCPVLTV